jgi:hypothetical protein
MPSRLLAAKLSNACLGWDELLGKEDIVRPPPQNCAQNLVICFQDSWLPFLSGRDKERLALRVIIENKKVGVLEKRCFRLSTHLRIRVKLPSTLRVVQSVSK